MSCCICAETQTFTLTGRYVNPHCPVHGDYERSTRALLDAAETPPPCERHGRAPCWSCLQDQPSITTNLPLPREFETGCICRIVEVSPEVELAIHEDCPIHWRETPDE